MEVLKAYFILPVDEAKEVEKGEGLNVRNILAHIISKELADYITISSGPKEGEENKVIFETRIGVDFDV